MKIKSFVQKRELRKPIQFADEISLGARNSNPEHMIVV